jgi:O-antigen ligase
MFKDKPIFGHGPKMFRVICKDEKYATGIILVGHIHIIFMFNY